MSRPPGPPNPPTCEFCGRPCWMRAPCAGRQAKLKRQEWTTRRGLQRRLGLWLEKIGRRLQGQNV